MSCCYLFIVPAWSCTDLNTTNSNWKLKHFPPNFNLIGVLVFIYFQDSDLSLNNKQHNGNSSFITCQTDTYIGGIKVKKYLTFLVHLKEKITGLNKELLLISFGHLSVFFIIGH